MSKSDTRAKRKFGPAEVAAAIGVKRATLHSWMARRYIEIESQGPGVAREFSIGQVVCLGALAAMTRRGFEIGAAVEILESVKSDFLDAARQPRNGHGVALMVEGDKAWIGDTKSLRPWIESWDDPVDVRRPIDAYFILLGPLVAQLRAALDANG